MTPTKILLTKLNLIMAELDYIQKDKVVRISDSRSYNYASEYAIKKALHPLFVEHKIIPKFEVISSEQIEIRVKNDKKDLVQNTVTRVSMNCQLICCESGEIFEAKFQGNGDDQSDKGIYKAITGCIREFLKSTFLIPTGDDPEGGEEANGNGYTSPASTRQPSQSTKDKQAEYDQRKAVKIARLDELMVQNKIEDAEYRVKTLWAEQATLPEIDMAIAELEKMAKPELSKIDEIDKGLKMLFETEGSKVEFMRKITKGKLGSTAGLKLPDNANLIQTVYETIESELKDKGLIK